MVRKVKSELNSNKIQGTENGDIKEKGLEMVKKEVKHRLIARKTEKIRYYQRLKVYQVIQSRT